MCWFHVPGHGGVYGNEESNRLANEVTAEGKPCLESRILSYPFTDLTDSLFDDVL